MNWFLLRSYEHCKRVWRIRYWRRSRLRCCSKSCKGICCRNRSYRRGCWSLRFWGWNTHLFKCSKWICLYFCWLSKLFKWIRESSWRLSWSWSVYLRSRIRSSESRHGRYLSRIVWVWSHLRRILRWELLLENICIRVISRLWNWGSIKFSKMIDEIVFCFDLFFGRFFFNRRFCFSSKNWK